MKRTFLPLLRCAAFLGVFALVAILHGQGITTAALSGFVMSKEAKPVPNATVTVVHEPTGTKASTTSRANGQFNLSGLRVGGPYTVTASLDGYRAETHSDLYLDLSSAAEANFTLATEMVVMEAVKSTADRDLTFSGGKVGAGTTFESQQIAEIATVRRNVQDIAVLDSRLFLNSLDQGGQLSAQGQNFRFNSLLIDGVQSNDPFGLNSSGFSSLRSPIPPEWVQSMSVELSPYDVRRSGFTGALINVVTKSGTNRFSGMVYGEYSDLNNRAKNPVTQVREFFRERTYGFYVGGPILKNRLFFFVGEDDFRRTTLAPTQLFAPDATTVQQVVAQAKALGYDPGTFTGAAAFSVQKSYIAKLDWNISQAHRLSLQYRDNYGLSPVYVNFNTSGTTTSFSNYWYDAPIHSHGYTAQLFSNWLPNFRTEASIGHTTYDGSPRSHSSPFPEVLIQNVPGINTTNGVSVTNGQLFLGTDASRQLNGIVTKTDNLALTTEYSLGNHTFAFGGDYEKKQVWDAFISRYYGSYTFRSVADALSGTNATLSQLTLSPGTTISDALAVYTYTQRGLFLQDTWSPNTHLTVSAGIRFDDPYLPIAPSPIPTTTAFSEASFQTAFGMRSTATNSGNYTIAPRIGFRYLFDADRKTQVRGGIGLFQGGNPSVWIANPYQNRGVTSNVTTAGVNFSPTINPPTVGAPGIATVNLTDPSFRPPVSWKGNLAFEHTLPFAGLVLGVEGDLIRVQRALTTLDLNLRQTGVNPDGRNRYAGAIIATTSGSARGANGNPAAASFYQNAGFADVMYLTNTKKGGGYDVTFSLRRPFRNNWSASVSWTYSDYTEVSPATSSVALSNYNLRKIANPNEDEASTANTNVPYRIVGQFSYQLNLIKNAPTRLSLTYQGRTGHNYSWVFFGDANGDGFTFNDLFYMPAGPTDPRVRWNSTTERDNFFAFAHSNGIERFAGLIVPRNSETSPWVNTVDLKFTQELPIYRRLKSELFLNFLNVGNFLDKKWGRQSEVVFSYGRAIASTTYDAVNNQYVYNYTPTTLDSVPTVANEHPVSRWQMQFGARVKF